MQKLAGKVAVVTGATSGMGRSIAELFAQQGAAVVISGRDETRAAEVAEGIRRNGGRAEVCLGDVADLEVDQRLVETAVRSFGGLDIVSANAGTLGLGSLTEVSLETWHQTIDTNLNAVFYLLRCALPLMKRRPSGSVVVTGSIAAFKGFPNHAAYCAAKGALVPLIKQVAVDYGPSIRANLICPGPVDTPLIWASAAAFPDPATAVQQAGERTPMKRLGAPADIADAALFLASDDARWITGSALTIDGGVTCL